MDCPQCGYVMDPFEQKCPRCARLGAKAPPAAVAVEAPKETLATRLKSATQDTASQFKAVPLIKLPKMEEPELGWTLTVSLWITIGLNGLITLILLIAGLVIARGNIFLVMLSALSPGACLIAALALLRSQRWGFWLYTLFAVIPIFWMLMANGIGWLFENIIGWLVLLLFVLPSLCIFFLVLGKWGDFE